jgi:hypothetical protein
MTRSSPAGIWLTVTYLTGYASDRAKGTTHRQLLVLLNLGVTEVSIKNTTVYRLRTGVNHWAYVFENVPYGLICRISHA